MVLMIIDMYNKEDSNDDNGDNDHDDFDGDIFEGRFYLRAQVRDESLRRNGIGEQNSKT